MSQYFKPQNTTSSTVVTRASSSLNQTSGTNAPSKSSLEALDQAKQKIAETTKRHETKPRVVVKRYAVK
jgi:hypothetical protein